MTTVAEVQAKVHEYVGTKWQHQARVLGLGVDCVGLILCVAEDLGLADVNGKPLLRTDYKAYSAQPTGGFVHDECCRRLIRKLRTKLAAGDVVTMKLPVEPCHTGIITEYNGVLYLVHAYNGGDEKVTEHILDEQWLRRIVGVFSFPGVV